MTSVAQIVRGIIDDLSDGVSDLVLIVVIMAEQNAPVPEPLPNASSIVNQTANTLANIARELAKTDYVDFAEIVKEINEASAEVEVGTQTMEKAMSALQSNGDRKTGWNGLVDACRVMSGNTIKLLQIVYGADLKRLQLTADDVLNSIDGVVKPSNLRDKGNQQKFVDDMGTVVTGAVRLAELIDKKADDCDDGFGRDKLRNIAKELMDLVREVTQAGNEALANPDANSGLFEQKLKELQDKIRRAKRAVYDAETTPPSVAKLQGLGPLIKAIKSVEDLNKDGRKGPGYERAKKAVVDDLSPIIRQLKIGPKKDRIDGDRVEQSLADLLKNLRKSGPGVDKDVEDSTKWLLDALNNLRKKQEGGSASKDDLDEFNNALGNLKKLLTGMVNRPQDKEQMASDQFKDSLGLIKRAAKDGDTDKVPQHLRNGVNNAKNFANQLRENAKNDPHNAPRMNQTAENIEMNLPFLVNKSKAALGSGLKDGDDLNDMLAALRRLQRATAMNDPNADRDLNDHWQKILDAIRKAREGLDKGNKQDQEDGLRNLRDALAGLRRCGDRLAENHPNRREIDEPMHNIRNMLDKYGDLIRAAGNGDKSARQDLDKIPPELNIQYQRLDNATKNSALRPIQAVCDAINKVQGSVDAGNQETFTPNAKELFTSVQDLGNHIDTLPTPTKNKLREHNEKLTPLMKTYIQTARESMKNPEDSNLVEAANNAAERLRVPLYEMKKIIDQDGKDRDVEAAGAEVKRCLAELKDALASGDKDRIREALENLRNAMDRYNNMANDHTEKVEDPHKKRALGDALKDVRNSNMDIRALNDPNDKNRMKEVADSTNDAIENFLTTVRNDNADDIIRGAAIANNLVASLANQNLDELDLSDLLGTADSLSALLRGLMGDPNMTQETARKLGTNANDVSATARAARELDEVLARIDRREKRFAPEASIKPVELPPVDLTIVSAPDSAFKKFDLKSVTKIEDIISGIAYEIHEKAKALSGEADSVAMALARLGDAAREGNKTELLKASKEAALHLAALCKKFQELANSIPGNTPQERRIKDQLLRSAQGLRDMATQLKILCAVKAASIEDNKDNDGALTTIVRNLGTMMLSGLDAMAISKISLAKK